MSKEIVELTEDVSDSPLYSEDLAPVPASKRTWSMWNLAFIWVGMAVCIPTYMLASFMIKSGLSWEAALIIIGLANVVITLPMALNGHAGVKYGIPFPVLGRASFGVKGIHIASVIRALVACGWFGIQTWIGGLAFYAIWNVLTGTEPDQGLDSAQFICFFLFWFVNMIFVWKGTESIKWLEEYSAPILILMGILLIVWGGTQAGGFGIVLKQSEQLQIPTVQVEEGANGSTLKMHLITDLDGKVKAEAFQLSNENEETSEWISFPKSQLSGDALSSDRLPGDQPLGDRLPGDQGNPSTSDQLSMDKAEVYFTGSAFQKPYAAGVKQKVKFRAQKEDGTYWESSEVAIPDGSAGPAPNPWWTYILWFTAMVGFWATMSLSIADITRYTHSQKSQVKGQFIGLPGTMILYSFVGIFVTCAAVINFQDVLISDDAPWDPVSLLAKFESPVVVVVAQLFMLIATLSTNIAANVIAPANAFSNLAPKIISFKLGGTITGIIGIMICPWWILDEISGLLIFVSGLLGPVLGILLCDYFLIRKKELNLAELYKPGGIYSYGGSGFNSAAMIALGVGVLVAVIGYWIPALSFLYTLSWFVGFLVAFVIYYILMPKPAQLRKSHSNNS